MTRDPDDGAPTGASDHAVPDRPGPANEGSVAESSGSDGQQPTDLAVPDGGQPTRTSSLAATADLEYSPHHHHDGHRHHHGRKRLTWRRYQRRRRIVWALIAAAFCLVLAAAWVGYRLWQAHDHLEATAGLVADLQQNLKDGDAAAAHQALAKLQQQAGAAHSEAHDFLWSTAEHLPAIGPNLQAVRVIADSVDELSWQTLPPLVDVAASLDPSRIAPKNGTIDVAALQAAAPKVIEATAAIHSLQATVDGIDPKPLLSPIAQAVGEMRTKLTTVSRLADTASKAAQLLPPMLGADGKRTYLVVFQNSAELRATGGIFGAYAVISADHGKITLEKQGAIAPDLNAFSTPVLQLTASELALYTDRPAVFPADVNLSPDFPTAATLIREMYRQRFDTEVDGVIATDPVALANVLTGTGPVTLPNGYSLSASNAVSYLLSQAYLTGPAPDEHRDLFQQATTAVFRALVAGQGSAKITLSGLELAASQHRVLVWSANSTEEKVLAGTVLGGRLPSDDAGDPTVGVFLNDGTGGKMDYYLREQVSLQSTGCRADGRMVMQVTVTLTSNAPASGLPDYVTGMALGGAYVTRTNLMIFSPTGGSVQNASIDGVPAPIAGGTERGRFAGILTVDLKPGQAKTVQATVLSGRIPPPGVTGMQLQTTPTSTPATVKVGPVRVCVPAGSETSAGS